MRTGTPHEIEQKTGFWAWEQTGTYALAPGQAGCFVSGTHPSGTCELWSTVMSEGRDSAKPVAPHSTRNSRYPWSSAGAEHRESSSLRCADDATCSNGNREMISPR